MALSIYSAWELSICWQQHLSHAISISMMVNTVLSLQQFLDERHFCLLMAISIKTSLLLLLIKCYNLYKVLACSTTFFQLSLSCATFFQLPMFMLFISSKTSSSQRVLDLPIGLLQMGFQLSTFCTQYYPQPCVQHGLTNLIFVS